MAYILHFGTKYAVCHSTLIQKTIHVYYVDIQLFIFASIRRTSRIHERQTMKVASSQGNSPSPFVVKCQSSSTISLSPSAIKFSR